MKTAYSHMLLDVMPVIADLIPNYHGEMTAISRIHVLPLFRGLGYGTMVLDRICKDADKENVTLCLHINPYGDWDYEHLERWYVSRGFAKQGNENFYVRKPSGNPDEKLRD